MKRHAFPPRGPLCELGVEATKFVAKHWLAISSLAHGAEAA